MKRLLLGLVLLNACATTNLNSGIDLENFDHSIRPQDNFYTHVNGKWLARTEIPADKSNYGSFTALADEAEANIKVMVASSAPGTRIGDYFTAFMNIEAVEDAKLEPLREAFLKIFEIQDKSDLLRSWGRLRRLGVRTPLYLYINQDLKDSSKYIAYLQQSGLGLPDRAYYFDEDDKFKSYRKAYHAYVDKILDMTSTGHRPQATEAVLTIESELADQHWTRVQNRDREKTYNKYSLADLKSKAPSIDWNAFFEGANMPEQTSLIVRQPSYLHALSGLVEEISIDEWRVYLAFNIFDAMAPFLPQRYVDAHFEMRRKTLRGIKEIRPRWKRALSSVNHAMGEAVGKHYVAKHFKPKAKTRMKALVRNLVDAFALSIERLAWMTDATKVEARKKLSTFVSKIGYPDKWRDYSKLEVRTDDLIGNVWRARSFEFDRQIRKLGGPLDRGEWFMTPQTVNAYYNPPMNEIVFPAAILQKPFFNLAADDAVNYGAIGAVIGHELSHGFDDQGRKSDGEGNLRDWWTEKDAKEFKARTQKMVEQYDRYEPLKGKKVNGQLTLGENIGDLGGLTIAYQAYQMSLKGKSAPVIDGFTGNQRFFIAWAQIWRRKYRSAELQRRLVTDSHSPSEYRVIGILSNMPEFYEAFDLKKGDDMFVAAENRIKIW